MFVVALILLALAGGSVGTYFLTDAPRRRARELLAAAERERAELDDERTAFDERRERLAAATAACGRRDAGLTAREAEFDRRAITYADLAAENALLRTDLQNAVVHAAYLEQSQGLSRGSTAVAAGQRDRLGRAYFEEVVAGAKKSVTPATYPTAKQKVRAAAERVRGEGAELPVADEERALADLHAQFEKAVRAAVEREEQARVREQMREDLARQKEDEEVERAAEQAERERQAAEAALAAAVGRALADVAGKHTSEVDALRAQLAEAEAKAQRAVSLAQLTKQGHVYVISNVGSFGEGVFKIGMTRRRDPQDRVDELGDASVPFPFDVHAMIACADAPALEAALHRRFGSRRVNRVNPRKEFFRVGLDEIIAAVRAEHGEVEYRADAEALEYLSSRSATDADLAEIAGAFADAEGSILVPRTAGT